jgi:hypothetical protein
MSTAFRSTRGFPKSHQRGDGEFLRDGGSRFLHWQSLFIDRHPVGHSARGFLGIPDGRASLMWQRRARYRLNRFNPRGGQLAELRQCAYHPSRNARLPVDGLTRSPSARISSTLS